MLDQVRQLILRDNGKQFRLFLESLADVGDDPVPAFSGGDDPDRERKHLRLFLLQPAAVLAVIFFTLLNNFDRGLRVQVDFKEPPVLISVREGDREQVRFQDED